MREEIGEATRTGSDWVDKNFQMINFVSRCVLVGSGLVLTYRYTPLIRSFKRIDNIPRGYFEYHTKTRFLIDDIRIKEKQPLLSVIHLPLISYVLPRWMNRLLFGSRSSLVVKPVGVRVLDDSDFKRCIDMNSYMRGYFLWHNDEFATAFLRTCLSGSTFSADMSRELIKRKACEFNEHEIPGKQFTSSLTKANDLNHYLNKLDKSGSWASKASSFGGFQKAKNLVERIRRKK